MNLLRTALESPIVNRIGWTMVHFLWEASVVALMLGLMLAVLRRRGAQGRYLASCGALLLLAILPVVTFMLTTARKPLVSNAPAQLISAAKNAPSKGAIGTAPGSSTIIPLPAQPAPIIGSADVNRLQQLPRTGPSTAADQAAPVAASASMASLFRRGLDFVSPALPWLVVGWCAGVVVLSIWNMGGWMAVRRLRLRATGPVAQNLSDSATRLAQRMGIKRAVRLLQSTLVESPMVIGALRPVILLPASLLTGLSAAQLETLLAHELAHVRRHDYLINLLQGVVETLLFYHPAVWWISRRIRIERENCCDDRVVSLTQDRAAYVRALAAVAESSVHGPAFGRLAPAATGGALLPRIRRLLGLPDADAARSPRWLAGAVALALCMLAAGAIVSRAADPVKDKDFDLPKSWILDLEIVDKASGEPIPGMTLSVRVDNKTRAWTTDDRGHAAIEYDEKTKYFGITAKPDGFVPTTLSWRNYSVKNPIPDTFKLEMERGTSIGGIIQDESAKPIKGATVYLLIHRKGETGDSRITTALYDYPVNTDEQGRWRCDLAPKEMDDPWIRLSHPDYLSDEMYGATPKPALDNLRDMSGIMVMKKGVALAGRVVDQAGKGVANAKVMQGSDRFGSHYPETKTDKDGNFRFAQVRKGTNIVLTVTAKGFGPDLRSIQVDRDTTDIEFKLEPGRVVRGRVVDPAGKPLSGVMIATDTWRNNRSLMFRTNTDAQGRFVWNEAPADEVLTDVLKQGFMDVRRFVLKAGDQEVTITLRPPLTVTGTVVDAETGKPIEAFSFIPGINWGNGQPTFWSRREANLQVQGGKFEYPISYPQPGHAIRIEADGYLPAESRTFKSDEPSVTLEFKMKKGQGLAGKLKAPDGQPLAGADVVLAIPGQNGGYIRNGSLDRHNDSTVVQSDAGGGFKFPPQTGNFMLVVLHERGYAEIKREQFEKSSDITVQPWGRVTGSLRVGAKAQAGETVVVSHQEENYDPQGPRVYHDLQSVTDKEGRFSFNRVPPGRAQVSLQVRLTQNMTGHSQSQSIEVRAGETITVNIGGVGRPVIGRVNIPAELAGKLDWTTGHCSISTKYEGPQQKLPDNWDDMSQEERVKWSQEWQKSPEAKTQQKAYATIKHFAIRISADGTFRTEDVPAGKYVVSLIAFAGSGATGRSEPLANATSEFTIPEMPGGRSDEPLDIGVINVTALKYLKVGDAAPEFSTKTHDDQPLKLSDFKGKHVLVYFWQQSGFGPTAADLKVLHELHDQYGKDGRLVTVGLNLDRDVQKAQKYAAKNAITWPQGYLGEWNKTDVPNQWGIRQPGLFFVNPEGKLLARDLQGDAIKSAVQAALK